MPKKKRKHKVWQTAYEDGRSWYRRGRIDKAVSALRLAVRMNPDVPQIHHDLGVIFHQTGQYAGALSCFERSIALDDQLAEAWYGGGNALRGLKRLDDAVMWYTRAVQIKPDFFDAHFNLAKIYKSVHDSDKALSHYKLALIANPTSPEVYNNVGNILLESGMLVEAIDCFSTAISLCPSYPQAAYNRGLAYKKSGKIDAALVSVCQALQMNPDYGDALALQVPILQQNCDWPALAKAEDRLEAMTRRQLQGKERPAEPPFLSFTRSADPKRNLRIAKAWVHWLSEQQEDAIPTYDFASRCDKRARLTIGYISEQFRDAATSHLMAGMFARHNRERFRIIAYSCGQNDASSYRLRIQQDVDQFVDIQSATDREASQRIFDDRVDILVDLIGWMDGNRMGVLAHKPAPVQVNYLGYPGTTGASFVDYIIADKEVIPPSHQPYYSEHVVYLPHCYQVTDPEQPIDRSALTRSDCGLPQEGIVFCSFNTDYKIEPDLFAVWMNILNHTTPSYLWLLVRTNEARQHLRSAAADQGIDPGRLIFADPLPKSHHLARLKLADIALDTRTVNGHTTTSDALWAGVPVITLNGTHFASRAAGSILKAVGLDELVTDQIEDYQHLAVKLASQPESLKEIKHKLSINRRTHPLFDCDRFVRNLEKAYLKMWEYYCRGQSAEAFSIQEDASDTY